MVFHDLSNERHIVSQYVNETWNCDWMVFIIFGLKSTYGKMDSIESFIHTDHNGSNLQPGIRIQYTVAKI